MDNKKTAILRIPLNILYKISPRKETELFFRLKQGYRLDLDNPKTYNEKIQWIKFNVDDPLMQVCSDKYHVREFITDRGCGEILNELLWEGFDAEEIPFDDLPDKFVIKVTHGSGYNIICEDKAALDREEVVKKCGKWMKTKFLPYRGERFYGVLPPRIIVEKYIESTDDEDLRDYKIFCFNGEPRLIKIDSGRYTDHRMDVYDTDWNHIDGATMNCKYSNSGREFERPQLLDELLGYCRVLAEPFLHIRADFYIAGGRIYFGEITFTNGAGFDRFSFMILTL